MDPRAFERQLIERLRTRWDGMGDIVERIEALEHPDRLHLEARDEVMRQRQELAAVMRSLNRCQQEKLLALNHRLRND
jgi:hypothetical protein